MIINTALLDFALKNVNEEGITKAVWIKAQIGCNRFRGSPCLDCSLYLVCFHVAKWQVRVQTTRNTNNTYIRPVRRPNRGSELESVALRTGRAYADERNRVLAQMRDSMERAGVPIPTPRPATPRPPRPSSSALYINSDTTFTDSTSNWTIPATPIGYIGAEQPARPTEEPQEERGQDSVPTDSQASGSGNA